jgi:hypothetical protein
MRASRSSTLRRLVGATLVSFVLGGATVTLAACGDGSTPAPPMRTLTPSAVEDSGKRDSTASPPPSASVSPAPSSSATAPVATPSPSPTRITDKSIKAGILARISQEPGLQGFDIRIAVNDGIVYLRGRVRTKQQRSLVEQIALSEPGIKKVVSAIDVDDAAGY